MASVSLYDLDDPVVRVYNEAGVAKKMTVEEMMAAPTPSQVSNRTVYDRCLEWGCKVTRTNGNWVWMISPVQYRFKVRPPQRHEVNGKSDIDKMLQALALPWSVFIAAEILDATELAKLGEGFKKAGGPGESPDDEMGPCSVCDEGVIRAVMVKRGKKIAHKYCLSKPVEAEPDNIEEIETVSELELEIKVVETAEGPMEVSPRQRGIINLVFDLLVERGDPVSNQTVAKALNISHAQATSALAGLCQQGVVNRIKAGVYQARPDVMRRQGTLGIVLSGEQGLTPRPEHMKQGEAFQVTRAQASSEETEPDPTEDETLNELIDLIAPNGFRARHLPLIDQFKRSALALMREVNGA